MSRRSWIVSINSLYSAVDLFALETGELIEAKVENLIRLMFAESIASVDQPGFVPDQDPDFFDLFSGKFEGEQFHPSLRRGSLSSRMIRMNSSRLASAMR